VYRILVEKTVRFLSGPVQKRKPGCQPANDPVIAIETKPQVAKLVRLGASQLSRILAVGSCPLGDIREIREGDALFTRSPGFSRVLKKQPAFSTPC
jgi:hypothetical protein